MIAQKEPRKPRIVGAEGTSAPAVESELASAVGRASSASISTYGKLAAGAGRAPVVGAAEEEALETETQ